MRVAVFGLGSFGRYVALEMGGSGHDVLAMDRDEERILPVRDLVSRAVVGDAVDRPTLEKLGIEGIDTAVVSLGQNMSSSILLTLHLTELKVGRILVEALDDDHGLVLTKLGAHQIIFPEREMAVRLARVLTYPNLVDILPLGPDMALVEMAAPESFGGKSLRELELRKKFGVQVLAVKDPDSVHVDPALDPDRIIDEGTVLICMGRTVDLEKLQDQA